MELTEHSCKRCGGYLISVSENRWKCQYCGRIYDEEAAVKNTRTMREMFDETKQEAINNLRRNLYDAVNAEYISNTDVKNACVELKKYLPDDFAANFYEVACGSNLKRLTQFIRRIDVDANVDEIENVINFLIKSLQTEYLLELNNLVERAYKNRDLQLYEKYATLVSVEAEKVQMGVYETKLPREVFIAYSSKDMDKVSELCEVLEAQGLQCFVAARNLRHGKGSVENYDKALKEAMDHCKSFVFVSSLNSRSLSCDALEIEIPYVRHADIENSPAEYRNNYISIPHKFKKPRVEYRIQESKGFNAADGITNEFFDGYERVYSPEEVAGRILKQLVEVPGVEAPAVEKRPEVKKICVGCGTENDQKTNFCVKCGGKQFASSVSEYVKIKNAQELELNRRREEERKSASSSSYSAPKSSEPPKKKGKGGVIAAVAVIAVVVIVIVAIAGSAGSKESETLNPGVDVGKDFIYPESEKNQYGDKFEPGSENESSAVDEKGNFVGSYENITYTITADGVMTISGSGDMPDFDDWGNTPWCKLDVAFDVGENSYWSVGSAWEIVHTIIVEDGITSIGSNCFANFNLLKEVSIAPSVKRIGEHAFYQCIELESVDLSGVEDIGYNAFYLCTKLASVELGEGIMHVGESAFASTAVYDDQWDNGSRVIIIDNCLIRVDQSVSGGDVPEGIVCIADRACEGLYNLTSIAIPEGIKHIGKYAFYDCDNLTSVVIPASVVSIGEAAFRTCGSLETVTLTEGSQLSQTGPAVFAECYMLNSVDLPSATLLTEIGDEMFYDCESLGEVRIPDTITRIGARAFMSCDNLTTVSIPTSVTSIGESAFDGSYDIEAFIYLGSEDQWNAVSKDSFWNQNAGTDTASGSAQLVCMNGEYDPDSQEEYTSGLSFAMSADGSGYSVKSYIGSADEVVIPSTYLGLPVIEIGDSAFQNNEIITSVRIPASVVKIGGSAFYNADNLASVTIADESVLSEIAGSAFRSCELLESFKIPSGVITVGDNVFESCPALRSVEFEDGCAIEVIGGSMFRDCAALSSVNIPDSVTTVGEYAFYGTAIETLSFGENSRLTTINGSAFSNCYSLKSITLPASLTTVESWAFNYSEGIEYASIPAAWLPYISKGHLKTLVISSGETVDDYLFQNNSTLESVTFADSITTIGARSFYDCEMLNSVTFGAGITSIGEGAFNYCIALEEVDLPASLTTLGAYAFANCSALRTAFIPAGITAMGENVFYRCSALGEVTISEGITDIPESTFSECSALKSVTIPESVISIGNYAFYLTGLESIVIPESVTSLAYYSFADCQSLESVVIGHEIEEFNQSAFNLTSNIKHATIHASMIDAFSKNHLRSVVITGGDIPVGAFQNCQSLFSVTLPDTADLIIGSDAFSGCISLMSITIPEGISGIGDSAFADCRNLVEVINLSSKNIVAGDTESNGQVGANALAVHSGESMIDVVDEYAFITVDAITYLVGYVGEDTDLVFPDNYNGHGYRTRAYSFAYHSNITSVTVNGAVSIEKYMFAGCENLITVTIGDSVTDIGRSAFYNCNLLESVTVGNGVEVIGVQAFSNCGSLKTLSLGSGVEHISEYAFSSCGGLTKILLPASVKRIDRYAFRDCSNLIGITFADKAQEWKLYSTFPSTAEEAYYTFAVDDSSTNVSNITGNHYDYYWLRGDCDPSLEEIVEE